MKYPLLIPTLAFSFLSVNAIAADNTCKKISGHINTLQHDPGCTINQAKSAYFPDTVLMAELLTQAALPSCFSSTLTATLTIPNRAPVSLQGTAYSGLTGNEADYFATAVTAVNLSAINNPFSGWIFTKDVIIEPSNPDFTKTKEFLTVIAGTNSLKGTKGHLTILGNVFNPNGADFVGTFCP
jgi:hypothetical protein